MARFRIDDAVTPSAVAGWSNINLGQDGDASARERELAGRAFTDVLQCDHVLVLAGLGTSLCIEKDTDSSLFPTMGRLWDLAEAAAGKDEFAKVRVAVGLGEQRDIEDLLSRCQMHLTLRPSAAGDKPDIGAFVTKAEEIIRSECSHPLTAGATAVHEDFLRRLVQRHPRQSRTNLFTTNYDLCFETAAAAIGLPLIDGFTFTVPPRFQPDVFDYDIVTTSSYSKEPERVPRLIRLYKLHGSVDWVLNDGVITKVAGAKQPLLVYPRAGKYAASYSPPFLEAMSRFQGLLRQRSLGVICVCSGLNDMHVAEPFLSAVKANPSLRAVICAPDLCGVDAKLLYKNADATGATERNGLLQQLSRLIDGGDARITLINAKFPEVVRLMPVVEAQTEVEQHARRIKRLEVEMASLKGKAPA